MSRWTVLLSSVIPASGTRLTDKTFINGLLTIQDQELFKSNNKRKLRQQYPKSRFSGDKTAPLGVANGTSENVGLGKFWQDLEISEAFLISLEVSFLHGLYLLFLSLETFYQRVSGSDF